MLRGRPAGGSLRAKQTGKAGKMGVVARGGGGAHPDAERIRVLKDYATRAAQQLGSKLDGTVHCELLDYYACIMLQQHFAALHIAAPLPPPMLRADVVDIAKGYYVAALRHLRPEITIESVAAHASAVFSQLRAIAAERSPPLRRALEDGEAFDAAVHVWDVDATREDWVEKFTAAYKGAPPIITRYSVMAAAQAALEERERLSNAAVRDKRCVLHYIGDLELCSNGCGAQIWPGEAMLCCRGGKHILSEDSTRQSTPTAWASSSLTALADARSILAERRSSNPCVCVCMSVCVCAGFSSSVCAYVVYSAALSSSSSVCVRTHVRL